MTEKIALVVLSCDKYSELWNTLFDTFKTYWPDCPFDKFLVSNFKEIESDEFQVIKVGEDRSWSTNLLNVISVLKKEYPYILVTLDDLFIREKIETTRLLQVLTSFLSVDGNYLKLIVSPKHTKKFNNLFGEIEPGALYRSTCVFALWKTVVLENLLVPTENAWEFERKGSLRSIKYDKFYVAYKDIFIYHNVVVRGKILKKLAVLYKLTNSEIFGIMSFNESVFFKIRVFIFRMIMKLIPWKLQEKALKIKTYLKN